MENERREFLKALDFGSLSGEFHKSLIDAIDRVTQAHSKLNDVVIHKPRANGPTERMNFHIIGMGSYLPSTFYHLNGEARLSRHGMPMDPVVIIIDDMDSDDRVEELKKLIAEKHDFGEFNPEYMRGTPPFQSFIDRIRDIPMTITPMDREAAARCGEIRDFDPPKNYLFTEPPRQKKSRNRPDKITIARMNKRKKKR